jgi:hypothetical protein
LTHLRLCILFLGIALLAFFRPAAEGQVSAYGMVAYSSYGFASQNQGYTFDNDTASIGGGAFYNFPIHSRLTAGIDGRVLYGPASHGGTTADAALRIGFVPTKIRFRSPSTGSSDLRFQRLISVRLRVLQLLDEVSDWSHERREKLILPLFENHLA